MNPRSKEPPAPAAAREGTALTDAADDAEESTSAKKGGTLELIGGIDEDSARQDSEPAESSSSSLPPPAPAAPTEDPFAQFEGEIEGEDTQVEGENELAEESTHLIHEVAEPITFLAIDGKDKGRLFTLTGGDNSIGRGLDNDIILADPAVSRRHVSIQLADDEIVLQDLGSGNGTLVNGMRVHRTQLFHGDRVEVGGAVLVLQLPRLHPLRKTHSGSASIKSQTHSKKYKPDLPEGGGQDAVVAPLTSTEVIQPGATRPTVEIMRVSSSGQSVVIPRNWLLAFGVVGVVLALLLGATVTVLLSRLSRRGPEVVDASSLKQFISQGLEAYQRRNWDGAEKLFSRVLAHRPGNQTAMEYLRLIREAREHEVLVVAARTALRAGDMRGALSQAASVPNNSPLASDAEAVRLTARVREITQHLAAAFAAESRGQHAEAQRQRALANAIDPEQEIFSFVQSGSEGQAGKPREGGENSSIKNKILGLYQTRHFTEASGLARSYAASHPKENTQWATRLSSQIDRFSAYQGKILDAKKNYASVLTQLHAAYTLDMQISGGFFSRELREPLLREYAARARRDWQKGAYRTACQAGVSAWRVDAVYADIQQILEDCKTRAEQLMREARSYEKRDSAKAQALYREVLTTVPATFGLHSQAYQRLDEAGRSALRKDEDES